MGENDVKVKPGAKVLILYKMETLKCVYRAVSSFGQKRNKRLQILLTLCNIIINESFLAFGWSWEKLQRCRGYRQNEQIFSLISLFCKLFICIFWM